MIYFFRRAGARRTCEMRSQRDGGGYELIITEGRRSYVELFEDPRAVANRQCELRYTWLAHGWRDVLPGDDADNDE
jgi:hypothetical protein